MKANEFIFPLLLCLVMFSTISNIAAKEDNSNMKLLKSEIQRFINRETNGGSIGRSGTIDAPLECYSLNSDNLCYSIENCKEKRIVHKCAQNDFVCSIVSAAFGDLKAYNLTCMSRSTKFSSNECMAVPKNSTSFNLFVCLCDENLCNNSTLLEKSIAITNSGDFVGRQLHFVCISIILSFVTLLWRQIN